MFPLEDAVGVVIVAALVLYALGGGADFGGGVWDLFATGPRSRRQRALIERAIGPIWEANHVWLVLVVVLLFVAFPVAFAAIGIVLHIPLAVMLVGIVLRGSAFTFRSYESPEAEAQHRWSRLFAIASVVTPVMLGVCVGAIASGRIHFDSNSGQVRPEFIRSWLAPFPLAIGFLTLALFAFLAAVYLTLETDDPPLREDFRRRALWCAMAVGVLAWASFALAHEGAELIHAGLGRRWWSWPFHLVTASVAVAAIVALWQRAYRAARALAIAQVTLVILGWALAQFPFVIAPELTFRAAAAPERVLRLLLIALAAGAVVLFPSLWYLFRVFKGPGTEWRGRDNS